MTAFEDTRTHGSAMSSVESARRRLGTVLLELGLLDPEELRRAFFMQKETGERLGQILQDEGVISSVELAMALADQAEVQFVDLGSFEVDLAVASRLPEHVAREHRALPLSELEDGSLLVGVGDPTDLHALDAVRLALGVSISFVVVDVHDLERTIREVYRSEVELAIDEPELDVDEAQHEREEIWEAATSTPAVRLVNQAIARAIEDRASDIHFEPGETQLTVRARIDGVMRETMTIPKHMQAAVISRLKIMGSLDIAERRAPQDGRVLVRMAGQPVDLRIAVLPAGHGEQVVLRILQRAAGKMTLQELGMAPDAEQTFGRAIHQPYGAVIVCGPTGSGKTTTLYSALNALNDPARALMTIEDPIEYQLEGVQQIEVRTKSGLTFARGLRTILRSDPDVLLVGEIRDEETARVAIQAAMTGHLVLTSLHTHNAASSIERLKDMGVEPGLLAAALNCVVAQRLARRLCGGCREPYHANADERSELGLEGSPSDVVLYRGRGCSQCGRSGYHGRVALYEVMPIAGALRGLVHSSTQEIFAAAVAAGMRTLREDGLRLCLAGVSSLDEVRRVTGDRLS
jgi:type IV pilus assembly protein PilB